MILSLWHSFVRWQFGDFSPEEMKKFSLLGIIFAFVIGVYWTLRPIKDTIFSALVHTDPKDPGAWIPLAKIVSLIVLFPIIMVYSKIVDKFPRQKMFYALGLIYMVATIFFALMLMHPTIGFANTVGSPYRILGWAWYVFVESYGSIMVALFWAFASDISSPEAAKKGFPYAVMIGQLGSMIGPKFIVPLSKTFNSLELVIGLCAIGLLFVILGVMYFMHTMPADQLKGYHGVNEAAVNAEEKHEPGFFEGLRLLLSEKYLLGIFAVISIYEILATIMDFNFKSLALRTFTDKVAASAYMGDYSFAVNAVAFICLMFGISNIQRRLGVTVTLASMPIIIGAMMACFLLFGSHLPVLFWLMVGAKAMNYALNNPVMKQLYVPTTEDTKYKAQAWIETFGSRSSKAAGSGINLVKPLLGNHFVLAMTVVSLGLVGPWFLIALYLGRTHKHAIDNKKVVC